MRDLSQYCVISPPSLTLVVVEWNIQVDAAENYWKIQLFTNTFNLIAWQNEKIFETIHSKFLKQN